MSLRRTCIGCGGTKRRAYWANTERSAVIARCLDCGVNFNGPFATLPATWAQQSVRGVEMEVDPKAGAA